MTLKVLKIAMPDGSVQAIVVEARTGIEIAPEPHPIISEEQAVAICKVANYAEEQEKKEEARIIKSQYELYEDSRSYVLRVV